MEVGIPEVLNVDVVQSAPLGLDGSVHDIISVAGVAGLIAWHAVVLIMGGRQPCGIIHMQTPPVRLHYVTGETEGRLLGTVHMLFIAEAA